MKYLNVLIVTGRRFLELIVSSFLMSALITLLNLMKLLNTKPMVTIGIIIAWIIFLIFNFIRMRDSYFDLGSTFWYFVANLASYGLFGCVSLFLFKSSNVAFAWFFGIAKMLQYSPFQLSTFYSLVFFHMIGGLILLLAPIGMKQVVQRIESDMLEAQANIMPIPEKEDEEPAAEE